MKTIKTKKLQLSKETLRQLNAEALDAVGGASLKCIGLTGTTAPPTAARTRCGDCDTLVDCLAGLPPLGGFTKP